MEGSPGGQRQKQAPQKGRAFLQEGLLRGRSEKVSEALGSGQQAARIIPLIGLPHSFLPSFLWPGWEAKRTRLEQSPREILLSGPKSPNQPALANRISLHNMGTLQRFFMLPGTHSLSPLSCILLPDAIFTAYYAQGGHMKWQKDMP